MMSSASSITSRLRRPRKSIFSRPISSIGFMLELRDRPVDLVAVLARAGVGQLQRDDVGQAAVGDHDRRGVDRRVADDALEALRDVDDLLGDRVARDLVGQVLARAPGTPRSTASGP